MRRRWLWLLLIPLMVVVGTVVFPTPAALACPACYGLAKVEPGVYASDPHGVAAIVDDAERRVGDFYGGRESDPRILVCRTDACYARIGGGREKGRAFLERALMLAPAGATPVIAAHELSHVELHQRLGGRDVPHWFDEGLAVLVSDDGRYLRTPGESDRCRVPYADALAVTRTAARPAEGDYVKAACVVSHWVSGHGGPPAVRDLIARLRAGQRFADLLRT